MKKPHQLNDVAFALKVGIEPTTMRLLICVSYLTLRTISLPTTLRLGSGR